jgi:hypothetical protein
MENDIKRKPVREFLNVVLKIRKCVYRKPIHTEINHTKNINTVNVMINLINTVKLTQTSIVKYRVLKIHGYYKRNTLSKLCSIKTVSVVDTLLA